jgi:hypothetical protein
MLENIGVNFKLGQLFMTTFFCIIMFAKIYSEISYMSLSDAMYISLRVQCLSGSSILPKNKLEKIIVATQSIIAYLITSGFLIFSITE